MIAWVNFFTALFLNSVLALQMTLNLRRFLCCRQLVASVMNSSLFYYIVFWIRLCRFQYAHCVFIFVEVQHTSIIIGVVLKQMSSTAVQVCPWFVQRFKCTGKLKETAKKKPTKSKQCVVISGSTRDFFGLEIAPCRQLLKILWHVKSGI